MKYKMNKWSISSNKWFIHHLKIPYFRVTIILFLITAFLTINFPVAANITQSQPQETQYVASLQQGKQLYEAGRFAESVKVLQQVVTNYRNQGDELKQAVALSNLALAYQKLGKLNQAQQAITQSLELFGINQHSIQNPQFDTKKNPSVTKSNPSVAKILDIQGSIQLDLGKAEQALKTWQNSESIYKQINNQNGVVGSRINQAQAWLVLGVYRRSLTILTALHQELQTQPLSIIKAVELRSLGDSLQLAGDLKKSRQVLQQSLSIAEKLDSPENVGAALFSLGNTARVERKFEDAIALYQKAADIAPNPITKVQARINQLSLLVSTGEVETARKLLPQITTQLNKLPPSQTNIYARINLVQSLLKLNTKPETIAQITATAVQQAKNLADKRAYCFALGTLGSVYEKTKQFSNAEKLTKQALTIAQTINAPDISYRWHWQLGRLLKQQGKIESAIASYDIAVNDLQTLRSDLVAVNRDVQYSFKETVEPVYRESVALLLESQQNNKSEKTLDKARQRIESLQLAELDDYFRQACIDTQTVVLDQIVDQDNPTAAIIYPIILPEQLQVIVKIPNQPLRNYAVKKSQKQVETILTQLREYLEQPDRVEDVQALSQQIYSWLIKDIESDLQKSGVKTLVFVLDGALRNIPMATLYDGKQYLVEKYAVSLSLGLQLLAPKPLAEEALKVLAAGLVEPPQDFQKFPPLPEIKSEFNLINQAGVSTKQLLDQEFTSITLEKNVNTTPFNVLHLATHGEFSSRAEDTFILAADGKINVTQFDSLLRRRDENRSQDLEMLVLSACQTAKGDNRATLGLAGVSVKAGARSTLASLWNVNDKSTAILMGEFYHELANTKVTKAEALRRAQVTLLKKYPNYERPQFWAPYILVGNWL
jgi:CHAT domain-containing protein/Flp pilus assembly protein TadD